MNELAVNNSGGLLDAIAAGIGWSVLVLLALWLVLRVYRAVQHRAVLDVADRWIVVTGCDSGLGQGVVEKLVAARAQVIACCLTPEGAEAALAAGARSAPCLDITDDAALTGLAAAIASDCQGELWGVVHSAGIVLPGFIDYQPIEFYRRTMDVNFFAPVALTQKLLGQLRRSHGRVVLVSSVDGIVSLPGNAPYDASKFAMEGYADALRTELSFWDVAVSVVNPATMRTPMAGSFFESHRVAWNEMASREPEGQWRDAWPEQWLDKYIATNAPQIKRMAQDPAHAINDIVHALTARKPKMRYLSGTLAKTLFYALWVGPESWAHRFKVATIQPPPKVSREAAGEGGKA